MPLQVIEELCVQRAVHPKSRWTCEVLEADISCAGASGDWMPMRSFNLMT
jgi:hypothetical protein